MSNSDPGLQTRPFALSSSSYLNSFKNVMAHAGTTGLRSAQLRYSDATAERPDVAMDFLLNSAFRRGDREFELSVTAYFEDPALIMVSQIGRRSRRGREPVELPDPLPLSMALHEAISRRRSVREISGESLDVDHLATLLQCAGGVTAYATTELSDGAPCRLPLRAAPSGGGLYPVDILLAVRNVTKLEPGTYRFVNADNALMPLGGSAETVEAISAALPGDFVDVSRAAAFAVLAISPWRSMRKYGARGMRFALMEVGFISENLHLAATALGTPSCDYGGFYDAEINQAFDLDGANSAAMHVIVLGG